MFKLRDRKAIVKSKVIYTYNVRMSFHKSRETRCFRITAVNALAIKSCSVPRAAMHTTEKIQWAWLDSRSRKVFHSWPSRRRSFACRGNNVGVTRIVKVFKKRMFTAAISQRIVTELDNRVSGNRSSLSVRRIRDCLKPFTVQLRWQSK